MGDAQPPAGGHREARRRRRRALLALAALIGVAGVVPPGALSRPTTVWASGSAYAAAVLADSPAVYYRLDESSGATAADASGHGVNGSYGSVGYGLAGAIVSDTGDKAVSMSQGVAVSAADGSLPSGSAARTLELWINTGGCCTNNGAQEAVIGYGTTANGFTVSLARDTVIVSGDSGSQLSVTPAIPVETGGGWHLLDVAFASGKATVYVDGQAQGSGALTATTVVPGAGLQVGSAICCTVDYDEVAVYPAALSASRINTHWTIGASPGATACAARPTSAYSQAVLADAPAVDYRLGDVGTSRVAYDSSGSCRNGAYVSASGTSSALASDSTNGAVTVGQGVAMSASDSALPSGQASRTLELWVNTGGCCTNNGVQEPILGYGTAANGFTVSLARDTIVVSGDSGSQVSVAPSIPPESLRGWHLIDVTFDGAAATVYVDGQAQGSGALTATTVVPGGLVLGSGICCNVAYDEVAVYPTALSPARVDAHWAAGASPSATACAARPTSAYSQAVLADAPSVDYRLGDVGSSRVAYDSSGACRNGAYVYASATASGIASDPNNGAVTVSQGVALSAGDRALPIGSAARTLELWENTGGCCTNNGAQEPVVGYGTPAHGFTVSLAGNSVVVSGDTGSSVSISPSITPETGGAWHLIDVTYDGATATVYIDGQAQGSGALTATTAVPGGLVLGSGICCNVKYDEVAVYPTALSAVRIANHYAAAAATGPLGAPLSDKDTAGGGHNWCFACHGNQIRHGNMTSFPIDTGTGNFWHVFDDVDIPGRSHPLSIMRTYNSSMAATNGPLGYGWQLNQGMTLTVTGSSPNQVATVSQENGSQVTFNQPSAGSAWQPAAPRYLATLTANVDGTWTFVRQARDTYTFSAAGQLVKAVDLNGYTTTYAYTGSNLTGVSDPAGRSLTLGWTGSHVTSVTDANVSPARTVQYQYNDGNGDLTDVIDLGGGHWQFVYDSAHRLTTMKDPNCVATPGCPGVQNVYDAQGRVTSQADQLNHATAFDYTSISGATKVTDPAGHVEVDYYSSGLRTKVTRGYGTPQAASWTYTYDPATVALSTVTDPNGNVTAYTVDGNGNVLVSADALGRLTTATYNAINEPLSVTDPLSVTTTLTYDSRGNLTSVSTPLVGSSPAVSRVVTYNHGDSGHPGDVTSMVDADGKTWTFGYDSNGDRTSVTDPLGNKATSTFNSIGWLTATVSPKGDVSGCGCAAQYTTTYSYTIPNTNSIDEFGDVQRITDPLSHVTTFGYDADRNRTSFTDPLGNVTTSVYDADNRLTQVKRADTPQTTLVTDYNADGTVADEKDGKANAIQSYGYNPLGRVTTVTDALGNVTTYGYDGAGNRLTQQDPGGSCAATPKTGCTSFAYDVANQLTSISYSDGVTPNVTGISYDADGQRTAASDGSGSWSWSWDSLHRLIGVTEGSNGSLSYQYNLRGLVTQITYPGSQNVSRVYDDAGRWTSVTDWNGNTTSFGYDANSNLTTETLPAATGVVDTVGFDAADRVMSIADTKGPLSLFGATYSRDSADQLSADSSVPATAGAFRYTALNQLCYAGVTSSPACASPPPGATAYAFDAADNLTTNAGATQAFNAADELCWTVTGPSSNGCATAPTGATQYAYDARGNRTGVTPAVGSATTLGYDQANRLTGWTKGSTTASYGYSAAGLRMSKTVGSTTTSYLWDLSGGLPTVARDGSVAYVTGPGGLPLEQVSGSNVLYLHHDQLGGTRLITDASGTAQATYSYDPYGNLTASTGSVINPFRFGGQYWDAESGLYYLRARYYDPMTAQFLSRDPAVATTRQPYAYVGGNPLNATDPTGLFCWNIFSSDCQVDLPGGNCIANGAPTCSNGDKGVANLQDNLADPNPTGFLGLIRSLSAPVALGSDIGRAINGDDVSFWDWLAVPLDLIPGFACGAEVKIGENLRIAPLGNRGPGRFPWPHYHRRIVDPATGETVPGGGIGHHRPWEKGW